MVRKMSLQKLLAASRFWEDIFYSCRVWSDYSFSWGQTGAVKSSTWGLFLGLDRATGQTGDFLIWSISQWLICQAALDHTMAPALIERSMTWELSRRVMLFPSPWIDDFEDDWTAHKRKDLLSSSSWEGQRLVGSWLRLCWAILSFSYWWAWPMDWSKRD